MCFKFGAGKIAILGYCSQHGSGYSFIEPSAADSYWSDPQGRVVDTDQSPNDNDLVWKI